MSPWPVGLVVLMGAALVLYVSMRTQHVGGCDSWSYLAQSMAMRGVGLPFERLLSPVVHPPLVPLCHALVDGEVVSIFPPGYPLLLAAAGLAGLEFLVNPVLGVVSIGLMHALLSRRVSAAAALGICTLWATSPIVLWGSIRLMSDLPATVLLMASLLLLQRDRPSLAGAVLGFSLGVRPVNILFGLVMAVAIRQRGQGLRFGGGLAAAALLWGIHTGWPLDAPYVQANAGALGLHPDYFPQLRFLLQHSIALHPPLIPLAVFAVYRGARGSLPLLAWFAAYVALYAGWRHALDAWWQVRFLLPAYPALFMLAGLGVAELGRAPSWARWASGRGRRWVRATGVLAVMAVASVGAYQLWFASRHGLFDGDFERSYATDSRRVAELTSDESIIAAFNFSGPLRLYGERVSFQWPHVGAIALIDHALAEPRPVYAVLEPSDPHRQALLDRLHARYDLVEVAELDQWPGLRLHRVLPREARDLPPAQAPRGSIADTTGVLRGEPSQLIDGHVPPDGSPWDGPDAVVLAADASVTLRLPDALVSGVRVSADGNDSYRLEASRDGVRFEAIADVENPSKFGLRTRLTPLPPNHRWSWLRISPGEGDGLFSIAEVTPVVPPGSTVLDLAQAAADASGAHGWRRVHDELGATRLRPAAGVASLPVSLVPKSAYRAVLTVAHDPSTPKGAQMTLALNGVSLEQHRLIRASHTYHLAVPAYLVDANNQLQFEFEGIGPSPDGITLERVLFERAASPAPTRLR